MERGSRSFHWPLKACDPWGHNHRIVSTGGAGPGLNQHPPLCSRVCLSRSCSRAPRHRGFVTKVSLWAALLPVLKQLAAPWFRTLRVPFVWCWGERKGGSGAHLGFDRESLCIIHPRKMSSYVWLDSLLWRQTGEPAIPHWFHGILVTWCGKPHTK